MCSYGGENCSELSSPYVHMIALQVHVPIYKLFPGPFEDVEARIHAMQLKVPQSEHEGDPDPLDGTPIHHLNTSVKTSDHSLDLYEVLGHKDRDAALASLGLKKLPRDRPNMYVLGLWFPIESYGKSYLGCGRPYLGGFLGPSGMPYLGHLVFFDG